MNKLLIAGCVIACFGLANATETTKTIISGQGEHQVTRTETTKDTPKNAPSKYTFERNKQTGHWEYHRRHYGDTTHYPDNIHRAPYYCDKPGYSHQMPCPRDERWNHNDSRNSYR